MSRSQVVEVEDEHTEARFVAAEIARLVDEGWSAAEIAVFYRTNAQSRVLEDVLVRQQIPYQVIGGPRFYERAEIKDAIAYLSVLDNPSDAVSLLRIANRPRRGDRRHVAAAARHPRRGARGDAVRGDGRSGGRRASAPPRSRRCAASTRMMQSLQSSAQELEVDELRRGGARAERHDRGARGGADDRGARPDREPGGARRRRARVQGRAGGADAVGVPAGDLARLRPGRARRRGVARDADDDPQREGARVPRRVPDRDGGGDLPALALDRGQRDRGGAPARLRRHDAGDGEADADPRDGALAVRPPRVQPAVALPRRAAGGGGARAAAARPRGRATAPSGRRSVARTDAGRERDPVAADR